MAIKKPYGFGVVKSGKYYWIVSVSEPVGALSKNQGFPWVNIGIGHSRKETAIRSAKCLASLYMVKYVADHLYL